MNLKEALDGIDRHGWTAEIELGEFIASIIKLVDAKNVLETGVFKGQTSCCIIDAVPKDGKYIGIDIKDYRTESVKKYMAERSNVNFVLNNSIDEIKKISDTKFDIIFLDSDHKKEYLEKEFECSLDIIKLGGYFVLHDLNLRGVRAFVEELKLREDFQVVEFDNTTKRHHNTNVGFALVKYKFHVK